MSSMCIPEKHDEHTAAKKVFDSLKQTYKLPKGLMQVLGYYRCARAVASGLFYDHSGEYTF